MFCKPHKPESIKNQKFDLIVQGSGLLAAYVTFHETLAGKSVAILLPKEKTSVLPVELFEKPKAKTAQQFFDHLIKQAPHLIRKQSAFSALGPPTGLLKFIRQRVKANELRAHVPKDLLPVFQRAVHTELYAVATQRLCNEWIKEAIGKGAILLPSVEVLEVDTRDDGFSIAISSQGQKTKLRAAQILREPASHSGHEVKVIELENKDNQLNCGLVKQDQHSSCMLFPVNGLIYQQRVGQERALLSEYNALAKHSIPPPVFFEQELNLFTACSLFETLHEVVPSVLKGLKSDFQIGKEQYSCSPFQNTEATSLEEILDECFDEAKSTGIPFPEFRKLFFTYAHGVEWITNEAYELHSKYADWRKKWLHAEVNYLLQFECLESRKDLLELKRPFSSEKIYANDSELVFIQEIIKQNV